QPVDVSGLPPKRDDSAVRHLEDANRPPVERRREHPVRADGALAAGKRRLRERGAQIPDARGSVDPRGDDLVAVIRERRLGELARPASERPELTAGARTPDERGLVVARGDEAAAVTAELEAVEEARVAAKQVDLIAVRLPEPNVFRADQRRAASTLGRHVAD